MTISKSTILVGLAVASADTNQLATVVAARNIGKPPVVSGECEADIAAMIQSLSPGNYIAIVSANNSDGSARDAASAPFTR